MVILTSKDSDSIARKVVTRNGVERKSNVRFWINIEMTGDNPSVSIDFLHLDNGDVHRVELDDCFPVEELPQATIDSSYLFSEEALACSGKEILRSLMGAIIARVARVELIYLKSRDGIRVNLIVRNYKTQGFVPRQQAERFLVLPVKK